MNQLLRLAAALAAVAAAAGLLIIGNVYRWWPAYPLAALFGVIGWMYASPPSRRK